MYLSGDFGPLAELAAGMERVGEDFVARALPEAEGQVALDLVRLGYPNQTSPFGVPWQPSKRALRDGGLTLVKSGTLLSGWRMSFSTGTFRLQNDVVYARIHQYGWPRGAYHPPPPLPPRPQVPEENENLGTWGVRFGEAANGAFTATIGGRALSSADDLSDLSAPREP